MRKQGRTARESNTSNSPLSPLTESSPTRPSRNGSGFTTCFETRPAMTRHTNIALLPLPPPAFSWATPLPANVQIAAAADDPRTPGKLHAPPYPSYFAESDVGPMQWNLMTSFPSATQRAFSSSAGHPIAALALTISRYSSNRATVLDPFWTLKIISTWPVNAFGLQLVWKIISTTLREWCPSGNFDTAGKIRSSALINGRDETLVLGRMQGVEPGSDFTSLGFLETGFFSGGECLGFLCFDLVVSTTSLRLWTLFRQLALGIRFLGVGW